MRKKTVLRIDILTIFPRMFTRVFDESIISKARDKGLVDIRVFDIRDEATDTHRSVDDKVFGGGAGMVMKIEPLYRILRRYKDKQKPFVILLTPQGSLFNQDTANRLLRKKHLVLICGHYEGVDERIKRFINREVSIGDVVLTGGEIPAMVVVDAVTRLIPGVVQKQESIENDSFYKGRLDHPHYTRPAVFKGMNVPGVLISGNHAKILQWRKTMILKNTLQKRPDLFKKHRLTEEEHHIIKQLKGRKL
ncbi:MAG: tRNA (guanosine(37)-N1)-methyltransferase TrmD [bacterium]